MAKAEKYISSNGNEYTISGSAYCHTFANSKGEASALGFDSRSDVKDYIEKREKGKKHFMDKID